MEKTDIHQDKNGVYEIGYLLVPTIPEEGVAGEVQSIKTLLEKYSAVFISDDFPSLQSLAYSIGKKVEGQGYKFDRAYFGWIKFETLAKNIPEIKKELDKNDHILRSMIISTVRENTLVSQKVIFKPQSPEVEKKKVDEVDAIVSEEELDKTIENLVVE